MEKHIMIAQKAYDTCDLYKRIYGDFIDFSINDEIFGKLPIITKKQVQLYYSKNDEWNLSNNDIDIYETSGTTGIPLKIIWSRDEYIKSNFYTWKYRTKWYNITPEMKYCTFHSCITSPKGIQKIDAVITNFGRTLSLGRYIFDNKTLTKYIEMIDSFEAEWLLAPTSVLLILARYMIINNISLPKIVYVEFNGEYVDSYAMDIVKKAFPNSKIANLYGSTEFNGIALTCPFGQMHILKNNVFLESITTNGLSMLYVTGLINTVMPLVRYQIGDIGEISESSCKCGCTSPILNLKKGRIHELLQFKHNVHFDPAAFNNVVCEINCNYLIILQFQIKIISYGKIELLILLNSEFKEKIEFLESKILEMCKNLNPSLDYFVKFIYDETQMLNCKGKFSFIYYE